MPRQRIFYIDFIRAVAILAIVATHALVLNIPGKAYYYTSMFVGSASLFFMTSGALIFPVGKTGPFLRRRLLSFMPAFLIWSVAYWALLTFAGGPTDGPRPLQWIIITPTCKVGPTAALGKRSIPLPPTLATGMCASPPTILKTTWPAPCIR